MGICKTTDKKMKAQRRAMAHLARTCMANGHFADLFEAFRKACPEVARKHWDSTGRDDALAGANLGMGFDGEGDNATTVLDAYLFGDWPHVLRMVTGFNEQLTRIDALVASGKLKYSPLSPSALAPRSGEQ